MPNLDKKMPDWINKWLLISALVCIVDGAFCVLRPHSLPGGCLATFFYPYKYYIMHDRYYADPTDSFIWTQGFGNLIESALNLVVFFNLLKSERNSKLLAIFVSAMTFWKTVLYFLYCLDVGAGGHVIHSWFSEFVVFGMGLFWIICPAYATWVLMQDFCDIKRKSSQKSVNGTDVTDSPSNRRYNLRTR